MSKESNDPLRTSFGGWTNIGISTMENLSKKLNMNVVLGYKVRNKRAINRLLLLFVVTFSYSYIPRLIYRIVLCYKCTNVVLLFIVT